MLQILISRCSHNWRPGWIQSKGDLLPETRSPDSGAAMPWGQLQGQTCSTNDTGASRPQSWASLGQLTRIPCPSLGSFIQGKWNKMLTKEEKEGRKLVFA